MAKKAIDEILQKEKDCDERLDAAKKRKPTRSMREIIAAADKRKQEITDNAKKAG